MFNSRNTRADCFGLNGQQLLFNIYIYIYYTCKYRRIQFLIEKTNSRTYIYTYINTYTNLSNSASRELVISLKFPIFP